MDSELLSNNTGTGLLWVFGHNSNLDFLPSPPSPVESFHGGNPCILVLSIQPDSRGATSTAPQRRRQKHE